MKRLRKITVVIIEDSALMRKELTAIINSDPGMQVLASAADGVEGLQKVKDLQPDVVTIDINMPRMDGLTCLQYIMLETPRPCVIISAHAGKDSLETFEALELGAVDFVQKPSGEISRNISVQARNIVRCLRSAAEVNLAVMTVQKAITPVRQLPVAEASGDKPDKVVVIGVSTGGPRSLMQLISAMPGGLGAPVLIIQHMPENFTSSFADRLNQYSLLPVREARQGEELLNNEVYIAPGGHHLTLMRKADRVTVHISRAKETDILIPSVDKALHSATDLFDKRTVGVILTGMGNDGSEAMERLHRIGGVTIAESEKTAVIFGMPKEVIERGAARIVAPLGGMASEIVTAVKRMKRG